MTIFARLFQMIVVAGLLCGVACGGKGTGGPITSCPASRPAQTMACTGAFTCQFEAGCTCHGCCVAFWGCVNGTFKQTDFNETCGQGPPCDDGGAGTGGSCTFGADQSCNDNPILSSIRGHCTDAGTCACTFDAGTNPDSGRCL